MKNALTAERLDNLFVALADETRRAILARLSSGEARVTEVAIPFSISLNSVSKHIRILERAGLITRRRSGREHILRLEPQSLAETSDWLQSRTIRRAKCHGDTYRLCASVCCTLCSSSTFQRPINSPLNWPCL